MKKNTKTKENNRKKIRFFIDEKKNKVKRFVFLLKVALY